MFWGQMFKLNKNDRDFVAWNIHKSALLYGEFLLSSGKKSSIYIDKYLFETDWSILGIISQKFCYFMDGITLLACTELGGIALAASAAEKLCKNFVIVRKVKEYGTAKEIEGKFTVDDQVLLIEDIVTTGSQIIKAANILTAAGVKIKRIVTVVDREEGGRKNIEDAGYEFHSLVTMQEILNAIKQG